jgi:hypothetical protein
MNSKLSTIRKYIEINVCALKECVCVCVEEYKKNFESSLEVEK